MHDHSPATLVPSRGDRLRSVLGEQRIGTSFALAFAIAISAVDVPRLSNDRNIIAALSLAALLFLLGVIARHPPSVPRRWPPVLLASWVAWAFLAPVFGAPFNSFTTAAQFAAVAAAATSAITTLRSADVPTFFARSIVIGFAGYLALSTALVIKNSVDASVGGRLALASLESNQLARAAALAAVSGLWMLSRDQGLWSLVGGAATVIGGGVTLATESRTALAALGAAVIVLALHTSRTRLVAFALGATLSIAAAWVAGLVALDDIVPATDRVNFQGDDSGTTLSGRETLWPQVWNEVENAPIVGHGLGNDRSVIIDELEVGWAAQHAHNLVMHAALTTGLVGLALLLAAIFSAVGAGAVRPRPFELSLLVIVIVDGISEPVVRIPAFGWLALCAAVLGVSVGQRHSDESLSETH